MSIRELSPELKAKAKAELNEDESRIQEDLKYIKEWLSKQPHLKVRQDDQWLVAFLRGCKYSLERTKEKIDFFYTMRSLLPEFFSNRDPMNPEIQAVLKEGIFLPLPNHGDPLAPRIVLLRNGCYDPSKIDILDLFKTNMMAMEIMLLEDDRMLINGQRIVQDMKNLTMAHMGTPLLAKKAMTCFQQAYPVRPKGIHFFNLPSFFEMIFSIFQPFLTEKMKKRVNIHTNGEQEIYEFAPLSILPKEYGGEGDTIKELADYWKNKIESYRDWFLEEAQYKSDEKKRPGKPKTSDEMFGVEGSFRQLNVD